MGLRINMLRLQMFYTAQAIGRDGGKMTYQLISGKEIAGEIEAELVERIAALKARGVTPGLAVVLVGEDPASQSYVRMKGKKCEALGMRSETIVLPEGTTEADLLSRIAELNADPGIHGFLVQLPLPRHIDEKKVIDAFLLSDKGDDDTAQLASPEQVISVAKEIQKTIDDVWEESSGKSRDQRQKQVADALKAKGWAFGMGNNPNAAEHMSRTQSVAKDMLEWAESDKGKEMLGKFADYYALEDEED